MSETLTNEELAKLDESSSPLVARLLAEVRERRAREGEGAEDRQRLLDAKAVVSAARAVLSSHHTFPQPACGCPTCSTLREAVALFDSTTKAPGTRNYGAERDAAESRASALASRVSALEGALRRSAQRGCVEAFEDDDTCATVICGDGPLPVEEYCPTCRARAALSAPAPDAAREDGAPDDMDRARAQSVGRYYAEQSPPLRSAPAPGDATAAGVGPDPGLPDCAACGCPAWRHGPSKCFACPTCPGHVVVSGHMADTPETRELVTAAARMLAPAPAPEDRRDD